MQSEQGWAIVVLGIRFPVRSHATHSVTVTYPRSALRSLEASCSRAPWPVGKLTPYLAPLSEITPGYGLGGKAMQSPQEAPALAFRETSPSVFWPWTLVSASAGP